eukprot:Gb_37924 [translate_table: standard]
MFNKFSLKVREYDEILRKNHGLDPRMGILGEGVMGNERIQYLDEFDVKVLPTIMALFGVADNAPLELHHMLVFLNPIDSFLMNEKEFWNKYFEAERLYRKNDIALIKAQADEDEQLSIFLEEDDILSDEVRWKFLNPLVSVASSFEKLSIFSAIALPCLPLHDRKNFGTPHKQKEEHKYPKDYVK